MSTDGWTAGLTVGKHCTFTAYQWPRHRNVSSCTVCSLWTCEHICLWLGTDVYLCVVCILTTTADIKHLISFSELQAVYCKHTAPGFPSKLMCTVTIVTAAAHHSYTHTHHAYIKGACAMGLYDLASARTIDCHTAFMVTPNSREYCYSSLPHTKQWCIDRKTWT